MTTEQEIQQIAERLRTLCNNDNDAPRLIKEYLGDFFDINELEREIADLENEIDEANKQIENLEKDNEKINNQIDDLDEKIVELEETNEKLLDKIEELEEKIEDARKALP